MNRHQFSAILLGIVLSSGTLLQQSGQAAETPDSQRPNFVILLTDDQGWGDVGYNGHPVLQTPVLDEMARTALRFDRFYAAAPVCSPTRGSIMTGRHPNRFGCFSWGNTLRPQEYTLAEALRDAGYTTGHFGKWHLGPVWPDSPVNPGNSGFDEWVSSPNFYENNPLMSKNGTVIETQGESSMVTIEAALPFIQAARSRQQPFLAVIWFGNPHGPHQALPELQALYPNSTKAEQNYYGEITGIDRAVGRLRQELKGLGIQEETLVWFTSDNGAQGKTAGSTGGLRGAKSDLWEGGIRVPTIVEWPSRIKAPRSTSIPGNTADIYPTLLELAGVDLKSLPHRLDGVSLTSVLDGTAKERSTGMGFWVYPSGGIRTPSTEFLEQQKQFQEGKIPQPELPPLTPTCLLEEKYPTGEYPGRSAWIKGNWKLHRIPSGQKGTGPSRHELYNIETDPQETRDVSSENSALVRELREELDSWLASVVDSLNGVDYK